MPNFTFKMPSWLFVWRNSCELRESARRISVSNSMRRVVAVDEAEKETAVGQVQQEEDDEYFMGIEAWGAGACKEG
jgi:hypothetical protein